MNEWRKPEYARQYLARMHDIPHRVEGESTLLAEIGSSRRRILDLGCGNGHLLSLVLAQCPDATGVGLDFSPTMLEQCRQRFGNDQPFSWIQHDMDLRLPSLSQFDCIVSSFAIHHCADSRKCELYEEVWSLLGPAGIFCNLEHVSSPTPLIHDRFLDALEMTADDEDPTNQLLDVETQLTWLRDIGFVEVDCFWKWRELALLIGRKPG